MRQASWIAFLLLTVGLLSYEAALDQQDDSVVAVSEEAPAEGDIPPPRP